MSPPKKWFLTPEKDGSFKILYEEGGDSPRTNGIVLDFARPTSNSSKPMPNYAVEVRNCTEYNVKL